jgi:hypothetical protein
MYTYPFVQALRNNLHQQHKNKNKGRGQDNNHKMSISNPAVATFFFFFGLHKRFQCWLQCIDYECDDEKKKNSCVRATPSYHYVAEDSRIPKMPVINPLQALVNLQTQNNYPAWIVNPQPQLLRICLFFGK